MFEIGIVDDFDAVLSLKGDFGAATRLHGHCYRVQVVLRSDGLDEDGVVYDVARLREHLRSILGRLHYQNLNELDEFRDTNPTVENVARHVHESMAAAVGGDVGHLRVTVWESPTAFASYWSE